MRDRLTSTTSDEPLADELCSIGRDGDRTVVTVRSDTAALRRLRQIVDEALRPVLDLDRRSEFLVAVNEAATNAIQAHHRGKVDMPFAVIVDLETRQVIIEDHGTPDGVDSPFPTAPDSPTADEGTTGISLPPPNLHRGRGHHIIRSICPDSQIYRTDDGVRVELPLD